MHDTRYRMKEYTSGIHRDAPETPEEEELRVQRNRGRLHLLAAPGVLLAAQATALWEKAIAQGAPTQAQPDAPVLMEGTVDTTAYMQEMKRRVHTATVETGHTAVLTTTHKPGEMSVLHGKVGAGFSADPTFPKARELLLTQEGTIALPTHYHPWRLSQQRVTEEYRRSLGGAEVSEYYRYDEHSVIPESSPDILLGFYESLLTIDAGVEPGRFASVTIDPKGVWITQHINGPEAGMKAFPQFPFPALYSYDKNVVQASHDELHKKDVELRTALLTILTDAHASYDQFIQFHPEALELARKEVGTSEPWFGKKTNADLIREHVQKQIEVWTKKDEKGFSQARSWSLGQMRGAIKIGNAVWPRSVEDITELRFGEFDSNERRYLSPVVLDVYKSQIVDIRRTQAGMRVVGQRLSSIKAALSTLEMVSLPEEQLKKIDPARIRSQIQVLQILRAWKVPHKHEIPFLMAAARMVRMDNEHLTLKEEGARLHKAGVSDIDDAFQQSLLKSGPGYNHAISNLIAGTLKTRYVSHARYQELLSDQVAMRSFLGDVSQK